MTIQECYAMIGGDYEGVVGRLRKDERILKYLNLFAAGNDYELIVNALNAENYEEAFRNVHNLKGVSLNLGLTPLHKTSDVLCEALRHGKPEMDITGMLNDVKETYDRVVAVLKELA